MPVISSNSDIESENVYTWNIDRNQLGKNIDITYKTIPRMITIKSIITISLIIASSSIIALIIYKRMHSIQKI